jgi:penicillin V acylase-like amidase (Ntn superfamily)
MEGASVEAPFCYNLSYEESKEEVTVRIRPLFHFPAFALVSSLLLVPPAARPCTTFYIYTGDEAVFGKSYDWTVVEGLAIVNKRGMAKEALVGDDNPARWVSTYGSVTFNQYGRGLPLGGINEAGLVVEVMWLEEAVYPEPDARPALDCLQWVQYVLDTCATVEEVRVAGDDTARLHYLVADAAGSCAAVEFLAGGAVVHTGDALPVPVLANDTYDDDVAFWLEHEGASPEAEELAGIASEKRFARAAAWLESYDVDAMDSATAADYAAGILDDVASPDFSQWRIVYDVAGGRVYWRTRENMETRWLELEAFDHSPATPVKVFDMNAAGSGDVTASFVDYTYEANRKLIDASFAGTEFLKDIAEEVREELARYPETTAPAE